MTSEIAIVHMYIHCTRAGAYYRRVPRYPHACHKVNQGCKDAIGTDVVIVNTYLAVNLFVPRRD